MMTLSPHQTKAAYESFRTYGREIASHKVTFEVLRAAFLEDFSKIPKYDYKPPTYVGNEFLFFIKEYYSKLRRENAQQNSEPKPQIELIELNAQLNEHNNELKICAKCGREFAGIKALHGHLRTCKPN